MLGQLANLDKAIIRELSGSKEFRQSTLVRSQLLSSLTNFVGREYASRIVGKSVLAAVRFLEAMPEWERHRAVDAWLDECKKSEEQRDISEWLLLWHLGDELIHVGRYCLAGSVAIHAAFTHVKSEAGSHEAMTDLQRRAALLIKAGAAFNNGGVGLAAGYCLSNGFNMIKDDSLDTATGPLWLIRGIGAYHLSRCALFSDAFDDAEKYWQQAIEAFEKAGSSWIGKDCTVDDIPELKLLKARILRGKLEILRTPRLSDDVLECLNSVESKLENSKKCAMMYPPNLLEHHIHFQRATLERIRGQFDEARASAKRSREALDAYESTVVQPRGDGESAVIQPAGDSPALVNTRRRGYLHNLLGEIALGKQDFLEAKLFFKRAIDLWSDPHPHYPRGLSRAKRNLALCYMRLGRDWTRASRLLQEAIALAQGTSDRGAETRALAAKVGLHSLLGHEAKVDGYEQRLSRTAAHYPEIEPILNCLKRIEARPTLVTSVASVIVARGPDASQPLDELERQLEGVKRRAKAEGLVGEDPHFLWQLLCVYQVAQWGGGALLIVGEPGTGKTTLARFVHRQGPHIASSLAEIDLARSSVGRSLGDELRELLEATERNGGAVLLEEVQHLRASSQQIVTDLMTRAKESVVREEIPGKRLCVILTCRAADLDSAREGSFLQGLARSATVIKLPRLTARPRDIPILGTVLLRREVAALCPQLGGRVQSLSTHAWDLLSRYSWPENIRELKGFLRNIVWRLAQAPSLLEAVWLRGGEVQLESIAADWSDFLSRQPGAASRSSKGVLTKTVPITAEDLDDLLIRLSFGTLRALGEYLKSTYREYKGDPDSLITMMRRRIEFRKVLAHHFRSRGAL